MSTVEIDTGNIIKRYAFWNPATWSIPKLYWDAWSQEQRLHAICKQLEKVIAYADYLGVNVDDIASRLKAIEDGELNDFIVAAIEEWFEDNEPSILLRLDAIEADGWVTTNRIADDAITTDKLADDVVTVDQIADDAVTTVKIADDAVTTPKIADGAVTKAKLDSSVTDKNSKMLTFGDSWIAHADKTIVSGCWVYKVADYLNLSIENYARAGALLSTNAAGGMSLYSQAQEAIAAISNDSVDQYEYIFIMGGVNDYNDSDITPTAYQSGLYAALNLIKGHFVNSKIILIPMNPFWTVYANDSRFASFCRNSRNAAMASGVACMSGLAGFFHLFGQSVYRPNDDSSYSARGGTYHPNNDGNSRIAQWIINNLIGSKTLIDIPLTGSMISENNTVSDGQFVYWDFKITIPNGTTSGFHDNVAVSEWDGYPMGLSDRGTGQRQSLPDANYITTNRTLVFVPFVQAIGFTNSISLYVGATTTSANAIIVTGTTTIMQQ